MPEKPNVHVRVDDRIATVTIDHPKVNALSEPVMAELDATMDELMADEQVKVVIITGAGQTAFVAGADIREMATLAVNGDRAGARAFLRRGQALFDKIEGCEKPVIAAVNGVALGGGLELALACHIRILSEGAGLAAAESNLGLVPGWGGSQRLARLVGAGRALEWIMTGDTMSAQEALRIGLANRVVPPEQLLAEALGLARKLAARSKLTNAAAIREVINGLDLPLAEALAYEAEQFAGLIGSHDAAEGLTAFLQKRPAEFTDD
jgi:enoyl-CoA hydratase/carnithine racemase